MHSGDQVILQEFYTSRLDILHILREHHNPDNKLHQTMLRLAEAISGNSNLEDALRLMENFILPKTDPNIAVLFYTLWGQASAAAFRKREPQFLFDQAAYWANQNVHPEILARFIWLEGLILNKDPDLEKLYKKCLNTLPKNSQRRALTKVWHYSILATQGIAKELTEELQNDPEILEDEWLYQNFKLYNFTDHVEACRINEALEILPEVDLIQRCLAEKNKPTPQSYQSHRIFLDISHELIKGRGNAANFLFSQAPHLNSNDGQIHYPTWVMTIQSIMQNKLDEALRWARMADDSKHELYSKQTFATFNRLRAELSAGNLENAKRIMQTRHEDRRHHYLDNFFIARICLLEDRQDNAGYHFTQLISDIERYSSWGRFDLELKLAKEVSPSEIFKLGLTVNTEKFNAKKHAINREKYKKTPYDTGLTRLRGTSAPTSQLKEKMGSYSQFELPVLITGETGTGKEIAAKALHEESPRSGKPYIVVNCGAIADTILESELFGHEKGAYTGATKARKGLFEEAKDGSIFLDEIGDISPRLQVALLRVLESGEIRPVGSNKTTQISCRVLAATNAPLEQLSKEGSFRKDLYYRLQRLELPIPPLRDRAEDILFLTEHFICKIKQETQKIYFSEDFKTAMNAYPWPGNVRELRNEVERMTLMNPRKIRFTTDDLDLKISVYKQENECLPPSHLEIPTDLSHENLLNERKTPDQKEQALFANSRPEDTPGSDKETFSSSSLSYNDMKSLIDSSKSPLRRLQKLKKLFKEHTDLTRKEIFEYLKISPYTASKDLKKLQEEGFIIKIKPNPAPRTHYFSIVKN